MSDALIVPSIVAALLLYWATLLSPLLAATYLAVFRGSGRPRRVLFVLIAASITYGAAILAYILVVLPVFLAAEYLLPALRQTGYPLQWFDIFEVFYSRRRVIESTTIIVLALVVVPWLWRRWPAVSDAVA